MNPLQRPMLDSVSSNLPVRRLARRFLPRRARSMILQLVGRRVSGPAASVRGAGALALAMAPSAADAARRGPNDPGGTARLHVGCGPQNLMADWWNVDIRWFRGVDEVADVTLPWPWRDLDYVYGEHFLEHLDPDQAVAFLAQARACLRPGGRIRLSTPSLEWVWATHLRSRGSDDEVVADTYRTNRAFHGWGHKFLYTKPFLVHVLTECGLTDVRFLGYGESDDINLRGLERHGTAVFDGGWPSVWNVEAVRAADDASGPNALLAAEIEHEFGRYVKAGH